MIKNPLQVWGPLVSFLKKKTEMEKVFSLQEMSLLALTKQFGTLDEVIAFCESSELLHNVSSVADEFWKETLCRFEQGEFIETRGDLDPIVLGRGTRYRFVKNLVSGINHEYFLTLCHMDGTKTSPIDVHPTCPRLAISPNQGVRAYYCTNIHHPNKGLHHYDVFYYTDAKQGLATVLRTIAHSFLMNIKRWRKDEHIIQVSSGQMTDPRIPKDHIPAEKFWKDSLLCSLGNAQFDTSLTIIIYIVENIRPGFDLVILSKTYQIIHAVVG